MHDLDSRLAGLSPAKRELFARKANEARDAASMRRVPKRGDPGPAPLSLNQERLWFLDQLQHGSAAYNVCKVLKLVGPVEVPDLRRAFEALLARHESLRTSFTHEEGRPVQVVSPSASLDFDVVDLAGCPEDLRDTEAARLVAEETQRAFDLASGSLLRVRLFRLAQAKHLLAVTTHHIVSDGWSMAVLFMDLSHFYRAITAGQLPVLAEPPIQYADFAVWQREQLRGEVLDRHVSYWREALLESPDVLELPSDCLPPQSDELCCATHRAVWPGELAESVAEVGSEAGATPFMTFFAAFVALLHRYTGRGDLVVGTPTACRGMLETESVVGFFANTLALRTRLSRDQSFTGLLEQVREAALGAYEHQNLPFDRLVAELQPGRHAGHTPLVQVTFGYQKALDTYLELPGVDITPVPVDASAAKFELSFDLLRTPTGLSITIEHSPDHYGPEMITRMLGHYRALLEGIVAQPHCRIGELPIMSEEERLLMIAGWNDTDTDFPRSSSIGELFESWAGRTPDAVAAVAADKQLTYQALNSRSNQLAWRLKRMGVGPGVFVGVCVEPSLEMAVAFLAVLKAGGAYVPLDPRQPKVRLSAILTETLPPVLLINEGLRGSLPAHSAEMLSLDAGWAEIAPESADDPPAVAGPEDLAYVIYTSGSTGKPKGIAVPHRAVVRLVVETDYIQLGPSDVVGQAASISFDAATFEIWGPMLNGARFVVVPAGVLLSPPDLAAEIGRQGITVMFVTTAVFNRISGELPDAFERLRCLLFGGEASDPSAVSRVLRHGPPERLLHVYGPTENTTFSTWHHVRDVPDDAVTVPIGRPIANTKAYVVDESMQPVPLGVPGELCLGGCGLAAGYLHSPELTSERFAPDPFCDIEGERLYRTGDLARHREDGDLEFLGRLDRQVKLRGFRIELAEIETVLNGSPGVREAAVVLREGTASDKQLVAYVVPAAGRAPGPSDLRSILSKRLPDYMIPSFFVLLERLPLTAVGKIDRGALPSPPSSAAAGSSGGEMSTHLETQLAEVWEDVLGIRNIGPDDGFFELGGHSLLAVRLFAKMEKVLGRRLPLATILQGPTIRSMAKLLSEEGWEPSKAVLAPIWPEGSLPPLYCVHAAGGNVLTYASLARCLGPDQPVYGLRAEGIYPGEYPIDRVETMASCYVEKILSNQPEGPYYISGYSAGGVIAFEVARQLLKTGRDVALLALFATHRPGKDYARRLWHARAPWWQLDRRTKRLVRGWYTRAVVSVCRLLGRAIPSFLVHRCVKETMRRAVDRYEAAPYPGRTVLFLADKDWKLEPLNGWGPYFGENLQTVTVPGKHGSLFDASSAARLAAELRGCLEETRSAASAEDVEIAGAASGFQDQ